MLYENKCPHSTSSTVPKHDCLGGIERMAEKYHLENTQNCPPNILPSSRKFPSLSLPQSGIIFVFVVFLDFFFFFCELSVVNVGFKNILLLWNKSQPSGGSSLGSPALCVLPEDWTYLEKSTHMQKEVNLTDGRQRALLIPIWFNECKHWWNLSQMR